MIRITAEQIYTMRNSTGKPFTDLVDRLIRSSAVTMGIPPSDVLDDPRTNYPDGGVDTQVTAQSALGTLEYFREPSAWQYKAVALADLTDASLKEEINGKSKTYVRELLQQHYGYRLCVAHDGPAVRKTEIKALLEKEIREVKPGAPGSIVLFASEIVAWVNSFPGIAAEMNGSAMTDSSISKPGRLRPGQKRQRLYRGDRLGWSGSCYHGGRLSRDRYPCAQSAGAR